MSVLAASLAEAYPEANTGVGITIVGLQEQLVGQVRLGLLVVLAAVALVLLIACLNVANLLLARASARAKEIALRAALGAGRARLMRQLLTESVILALGGGAIGLLLAYWIVDLLIAFSPPGTPRVDEIGIDAPVFVFTLAISVLTGVVFGLFPALQLSKPDLNQSLNEGRGTRDASSGNRLRSLLVVAEVAFALMILVAAGLAMKSFANLLHVEPGFNAEHIVTMTVSLPRSKYPEQHQSAAFFMRLLESTSRLPGVEAAGAISSLPLSGGGTDADFVIKGRPEPRPGEEPVAWYSSVTPDYFRAMGIRLVKGRLFTELDGPDSPAAVIITEDMARRFFPEEEPLGKQIGSGARGPWREIVGVVADVKHFGLEQDARPTMYLAHSQFPARGMALTVRTTSTPAALAAAVRDGVAVLDGDIPVSNVRTMEEIISASVASPRFTLALLATFAGLALLLAAVGVYGIVSYSVTQRTHEIGLRIALGAHTVDVVKLVVGQAAILAVAGVSAGVAGALAVTRLMETLLFGVSATDPVILIVIALLLFGVALTASFIPARRAAKVDPMIALRRE